MLQTIPPTRLIGCCGWPEGKAKYFAHAQVVELQSPFYDLPSIALAEKWRALAPIGFRYCMKAWQLITHTAASPTYRKLKSQISPSELEEFGSFRPTEQVALAWERTAAIARALQASVVVFQCPKSFFPTSENVRNLQDFFCRIGPQQYTLAWEPRGEWPIGLVREVCAAHHLVHCVDPLQASVISKGDVYWRLHGMGGYHHHYSDAELERLLELLINAESSSTIPAYVMFNNVWMKEDSRRFEERILRQQAKS